MLLSEIIITDLRKWCKKQSPFDTAPYLLYNETNREVCILKNDSSFIKKLTLEEKIKLIHADGLFRTGAVEHLDIPSLVMSDGPSGVRQEFQNDAWIPNGNTTDFVSWLPSNTCLCSTWNPDLAWKFGEVLGEEARGRGKDIILAPGINIKRTPLCGRNFEYMSEDPTLISEMVVPLIQGIQSFDVAACVKHFALNNQELDRLSVEVEVDEKTLREVYLPAFQAAVTEGNAYSIMGAYNRYDGDYCCEGQKLLHTILRDEWEYDGVAISDWGGVHNTEECALHGVDIEMSITSDFDDYKMADPLLQAVKEGKITEAVIDEKVQRILTMMERLHIGKPERKKGRTNTPEHQQIIQEIAEEAIILLKNDNKQLPLSKDVKRILVVGDNAKRTHASGGGSAEIKALYDISPMLGLRMLLGGDTTIDWLPGYYIDNEDHVKGDVDWQAISLEVDYTTDNGQKEYEEKIAPKRKELLKQVMEAAPDYDEVIFIGGLNHAFDVEGFDRSSLTLPYEQDTVIEALADVTSHLTVVLINGGAVELPWADKVSAIVQTSYCGMNGGYALAKVLFGETNPSGKLAETYPICLSDTPTEHYHSYPGDFNQTKHRYTVYSEGPFIGYRFYTSNNVPVRFPFGHGLSYTEFLLSDTTHEVHLPASSEDPILTVTTSLTNTGDMDGKETLQLYLGIPEEGQPIKILKKFKKIFVAAGETKKVSLSLRQKDLMVFSVEKNDFHLLAGEYRLYLGTSVETIHYEATFSPIMES